MFRRWQTWAVLALLLGAVGGGAWYWLLIESGQPAGHYAIDMEAVRQLALGTPGERLLRIRVEQVATFTVPSAAVVAGDNFTATELGIFA